MLLNPGELNEKVTILEISKEDNTYTWQKSTNIWAKVEQLSTINLFSRVGLGAKSLNFIIRKKRNLTLHNALMWKGKHCFLTNIIELDRSIYEVNAALIDPVQCIVKQYSLPKLDKYNRPIEGTEHLCITFPACMTEKYVRQTTEYPMSTVESIYVLVTPKVIELKNGELVTIQGINYEILVSHTLDEYKNEYEIRARKES